MLDLAPSEFAVLPLDHAAGVLLRAFGEDQVAHTSDNSPDAFGRIRFNFFNDIKAGWASHRGTADYVRAVLYAFEAWNWLESNGLIAAAHDRDGDKYIITRLGDTALAEAPGGPPITRVLDSGRLHRELVTAGVPGRFLADPAAAVREAMLRVEVRVREVAELPFDLIGVTLMDEAFDPTKDGRLADRETPKGEQDGIRFLFRGAMGALRNPTSHRDVSFDDPQEAASAIWFADLLLRMVDQAAERIAQSDED